MSRAELRILWSIADLSARRLGQIVDFIDLKRTEVNSGDWCWRTVLALLTNTYLQAKEGEHDKVESIFR
jgi:hypothetical protein